MNPKKIKHLASVEDALLLIRETFPCREVNLCIQEIDNLFVNEGSKALPKLMYNLAMAVITCEFKEDDKNRNTVMFD